MKLLFALFLAIWQFQLRQCSFDAAVALGNIEVTFTAVHPCEDIDTISYHEAELKDDGNERWLEFTFQTDTPLDTTIHANVRVDQWRNGAWQENIYNTDGSFCELKDKFASKAWMKFGEATQPKIDTNGCNVPAGTYVGKKFQLESGDVEIPSVLFGSFRVRMELNTEDDEPYFCTVIEVGCNRKY